MGPHEGGQPPMMGYPPRGRGGYRGGPPRGGQYRGGPMQGRGGYPGGMPPVQ